MSPLETALCAEPVCRRRCGCMTMLLICGGLLDSGSDQRVMWRKGDWGGVSAAGEAAQ